MSNFKSAVIVYDISAQDRFHILMSPWTDSYEDICNSLSFENTSGTTNAIIHVEFSPSSMDKAHLIDDYKLKIDESQIPGWFDAEMRERVSSRMRAYI